MDQSIAQESWTSRFINDNINSELALCLMEHKKDPNSYWKNWIKVLPKSYSEFPIFYTEEEISWLQGSPLKAVVIETRNKLHGDYELVANAMPEFKAQYSLHEYLESYAAVTSRTFNHDQVKKGTAAFVPVADMINHSSTSPNCEY